MQVTVFVWFDVEDYITAESDLALGRMVDILDKHGVKATLKMVGEKVRGLERRGHYDILAKLNRHDIGYHTDYHSRPPSIPEYMLEYDWAGGVEEFVRREQAGIDTLRQVFQRTPSCYGQPGGAWAPQVYPALRRWGIPVYLDAGPWVSLGGRPHRFCDVLDLLGLGNVMHIGISGGRAEVQRRQGTLTETVDRLRHEGGEVSLYAHECEFATGQFWDALNFGRGKDTPREQWLPAALVADQERDERFAAFDEFLSLIQSLPDVRLAVAAQAPMLYPDKAKGRSYTPAQIAGMCACMAEMITHQRQDDAWLSPAEVYGLAVGCLAARAREDKWPATVSYRYADGPSQAPSAEVTAQSLPLDDILGTCLYEDAYLELQGAMPPQVQVGRNWLAPHDFVATIGAAMTRWLAGDVGDARVMSGKMAEARYIPDHCSWDWVVFPAGFDADPLLEMAKLQSWTLKPAPPAQ